MIIVTHHKPILVTNVKDREGNPTPEELPSLIKYGDCESCHGVRVSFVESLCTIIVKCFRNDTRSIKTTIECDRIGGVMLVIYNLKEF